MSIIEEPTTVSSIADIDKRTVEIARPGDPDLGQLAELPGTWANEPNLVGRGWNLIALPFATPPGEGFNYRVLMNQYNEVLKFSLVDKNVPNRGISRNGTTVEADQEVGALDYEQAIKQIAAADFPVSGLAGNPNAGIHHEPGLFLFMQDQTNGGPTIGRLATVPHGDSVLALGNAETTPGPPRIDPVNALPIGVDDDLDSPYLAPYKHFVDSHFQGIFDPLDSSGLLADANNGVNIIETTTIELDTTTATGGISNIPFIVAQANATEMKSTFWIQKVDDNGTIKWRLQYMQVVMLDFFERRDGGPGLIKWPHISFNTMEKISDDTSSSSPAVEFMRH
ncbi:heme-binding protein [Gordonia sp. LSe1-13]|uniref:Heme-binding protein n=1 Tax=Gordonia sesuvii TaxID=3116777 RepID=A0ABU7MID4_9ACTN|nr:heme-binding protein [Gordonia sp. LSe1-13]